MKERLLKLWGLMMGIAIKKTKKKKGGGKGILPLEKETNWTPQGQKEAQGKREMCGKSRREYSKSL